MTRPLVINPAPVRDSSVKKDENNPLVIQAVWHKAHLFTREEAAAWCLDHDFSTDVYRTRKDDDGSITHHIHAQFDPSEGIEDSWVYDGEDFPEGISVSMCQRKEKAMELRHTKGTQSKDDPFEFIMSDESVDRMGDVIKADGWELNDFKRNPIALWGHNHAMPVGTWENVRVEGKKLIGRLKMAAEGTSAEIDTLRRLIEQRIIKAVSVGFAPIEQEPMDEKSDPFWGPFKFIKQALHECSLVSVPANPNALSVAKSCGLSEDRFKEFFAPGNTKGQNAAPVAMIEKALGTASEPVARKPQNTANKGAEPMKTLAEKIQAKQARIVQIKDRLTELKGMAEADDAELSSEELEEITTLSEEVETVGKSIEGLQKIESTIASKAVPAAPLAVSKKTPMKGPEARKDTGSVMAKVATAKLVAHVKGIHINEVFAKEYGNDDRIIPVYNHLQKTAVAPATTTEAGWAAELVYDDLQAFLTDLAPVSVYAALRSYGLGLDFGGANSITIPRRNAARTATNDVSGSWVGEGGVIPVKRLTLGSQTLNRYKAAVISTFTQEILDQSTPSIEGIVNNAMREDTAVALDGALLDNSNIVAGVRPAGLMFGVTATPSVGDTAADIITDLKVLFSAMTDANIGAKPVLIMNSNRLLGLSTVTTASGDFMFRDEVSQGTLLGVPVIASTTVPEDEVLIVDAASFAAANDVPAFSVSDQATLTMANADGTAPTQADDGAGLLGTAEQVQPGAGIHTHMAANTANAGYEAVSMYQTYSQALRMIFPTSWAMVRANAVAALSGVSW